MIVVVGSVSPALAAGGLFQMRRGAVAVGGLFEMRPGSVHFCAGWVS